LCSGPNVMATGSWLTRLMSSVVSRRQFNKDRLILSLLILIFLVSWIIGFGCQVSGVSKQITGEKVDASPLP
jgi:hypothetical protein